MSGKMRAARLYQLGEPMRIEEIPIPDVGPGEVLIRVLRAGLNRGDPAYAQSDHSPDRFGAQRNLSPASHHHRS